MLPNGNSVDIYYRNFDRRKGNIIVRPVSYPRLAQNLIIDTNLFDKLYLTIVQIERFTTVSYC